MTSTNLEEDDRINNNNNKMEMATQDRSDDEDDNDGAEDIVGATCPQKQLSSPSPPAYRHMLSPTPTLGYASAAAPLDFSLSPTATHHSTLAATATTRPVAVVVQESVYESVAKV